MAKAKKMARRKMRMSPLGGVNGATSVVWTRNTPQPPPVSNKQSYVKRKLVVDLAAGTALKVGDVSTAMGAGGGDFYIDKISVWAKPATIFGSATFTCNSQNLMTSSGALDPIEVVDSGTGTNRPGVCFVVPSQRRQVYSKSTSDTTVLVSTAGADATYHVDVTQYISTS
jgi:hypothetical protein